MIEILIGLVILTILVGPVYMLFSSSKRNLMSSQDLATAISYSSSFLTLFSQVPIEDLKEVGPVADDQLTGKLSLSTLGIAAVKKPYWREVTVKKETLDGIDYYHVIIRTYWKIRNSKKELSYRQDTVLGGEVLF